MTTLGGRRTHRGAAMLAWLVAASAARAEPASSPPAPPSPTAASPSPTAVSPSPTAASPSPNAVPPSPTAASPSPSPSPPAASATRTAARRPQLTVTHEPPPRHLRMRPRAAAAPTPPAPPRPAATMPAAPPQLAELAPADADELTALRDVLAPVSFSVTIGYQVDGARSSGKASLDAPVQAGRDYNSLRSYGFGELFFSMRGVALDSLSAYFALRFDAAQRSTFSAPGEPTVRVAPPITTWFERSVFELRTGWAEVKDFLPRRLGMQKLRLRAGNQYIYGPWVLHLDGVLLAYDGDIVTATAYAGGRHSDYTVDLTAERFGVAGASLRLDLQKLVSLPIAITAETMSLTSAVADQPDSTHRQVEVDWQPRRDITVTGQLRALDDKIASERLQFRARYREVTNLAFEVMRRFDDDWRWDPSLIVADDPLSARRYLDLGPVLPQVIASLRGGTLIAENIDLLARAAIAADLSATDAQKSSFSAAYLELGGALEVRLRRTVAVGVSVLSRQTDREDVDPITDVRLTAQPLPTSAATGERSFVEIGARARMSLGARRLSALLEVYGRRTRYSQLYVDPTNPVDDRDLRGGGRVSVEAWIGRRLKLFAAYDVSSALEFSPEITSYKSLRLTMTGAY